jgi:hypothetical protein
MYLDTMPVAESPNQAFASFILQRPVREWIAEQRELGWSWRKIADDLKIATNGQVDVSHESIRQWNEEVAV